MMRHLSALGMVLAVAVLLYGCGGSGDFGTPTSTFNSMVSAAKADDKDAVMACFCKETRSNLEELENYASEMQDPAAAKEGDITEKFKTANFEIGEENITGEKAMLHVTKDNTTEILQFVKEEGNWKVTIPELKMAVQLMKGMGDAMKGMVEGAEGDLKKNMEDAIRKEMQERMKKESGK